MRKMVTILNAMPRDQATWNEKHAYPKVALTLMIVDS